MHVHKATFWGIYTAAMIAAAIALCFFACGCQTIGTCERLAIAEELRHHKQGNPVFRVHYWWYDAPSCEFLGHARNYRRLADGTRSYYDVGGVTNVPAPTKHNIGYDSYDARVINGVTNPPTVAPRR